MPANVKGSITTDCPFSLADKCKPKESNLDSGTVEGPRISKTGPQNRPAVESATTGLSL